MVLNSLDNVAESIPSQLLLSKDGIDIRAFQGNVLEVSLVNVASVDWVPELSLVVGNGPGRSGHNSKLVVSLGVDRAQKGVLG